MQDVELPWIALQVAVFSIIAYFMVRSSQTFPDWLPSNKARCRKLLVYVYA